MLGGRQTYKCLYQENDATQKNAIECYRPEKHRAANMLTNACDNNNATQSAINAYNTRVANTLKSLTTNAWKCLLTKPLLLMSFTALNCTQQFI